MKNIRKNWFNRILTTAFLFVLATSSYGQFAGEDKQLLKLEDNSQTVTIGKPDPNEGVCYIWENSPDFVPGTDVNQPTVTVNPTTEGEHIYRVKRLSSCGVEEDEVKVELTSSLTIVSVTPIPHCWSKDDRVMVEQFVIETDPPGHSDRVRIRHGDEVAHCPDDEFTKEQTIHFIATGTGEDDNEENECVITVVSDHEESIGTSILSQEIDLQGKFFNGITNKLTKISHFLKNCPLKLPIDVDPPTFSGPTIEVGHSKVCCPNEIGDKYSIGVSAGATAGLKVSYPLPPPLGIPKLAGLNIKAEFHFGITLKGTFEKNPCSNNDICLEAKANATLGLGVGATVLSEDLLDASLMVETEFELAWVKYCLEQGLSWGALCVSANVVGTVTLFSFIEKKVEFPILDKKCLTD